MLTMGVHSRKTVELRDRRLATISVEYLELQREHDLLCQSIESQCTTGTISHGGQLFTENWEGHLNARRQVATIIVHLNPN